MDHVRAVIHPFRRLRRRGERAATLVEYALLVAVFVVPASAGLSFMRDSAKSKMGYVAAQVAKSPTTTTTEAGSGGGGGGSSSSTTSTTTAPSSTTSTTTSTTTTTTTQPPVTVPKVAQAASPTLSASKYWEDGKKRWQVSGSVSISDDSGSPVNGAVVEIKIEEIDEDDMVTSTQFETITTDPSGGASFLISGLKKGDRRVRVTVTSVTGLPSGTTWNGDQPDSEANRPSPW